MLSETLEELGLHHRRQRYFVRRAADLTREARGPLPSSHNPPGGDLETGQPGGAPGEPEGAEPKPPEAAANGSQRPPAFEHSGEAAGASSSGDGGGAAGGPGPNVARKQLELTFQQPQEQEQQQQQQEASSSLQPGDGPSTSGRSDGPEAADAKGLYHRARSHALLGSLHSQQQQQQQHQPGQRQRFGALASSPSEATDTEQILQPLLPPHQPPGAVAGAAPGALGSAAGAAAAAAPSAEQRPRGGIPRSIVVLSSVSMALTMASCVFNTLLPIYMVAELKLTMRSLGLFEGVLEAFSYVVRMFSGVLSDRMSSRKAAIAAGFAMGAAAKCGMGFSTTLGQLFVGKAVDRLGNGVQAAPRDALIGDLSPAASRSACFGFAQSMRKWGSFMGAGLVFLLMKATGNNYQLIFLGAAGVSALATLAFIAFVPSHANAGAAAQRHQQHPAAKPAAAAGAAAASAGGPRERQLVGKEQQQGDLAQQAQLLWRDVRSMGRDFYRTMAVIGLYGLGHINESLLEARAVEVGFGKAESTLVVALLCLSVSLCAYPMGRLDDKRGPRTTFALGMSSLVAGDLVLLASGPWPPAVFVACVFWGVHWAVVQGPMLSVVVGLAPPHLKGTAFGIFYSVMALTAMAANTVFGTIWHVHGAEAAFGLSAAVIALTLVVALPRLLPARGGGGGGGAVAAPAAV